MKKNNQASKNKASGAKASINEIISSRNFTPASIIVILLLTFIIYSQAISHQFLNWDDNILVYNNEYVNHIAKNGIESIFSLNSEFWQHNPVSIISHALTAQIWGFNNPAPFHFINILLHLLNILLLFRFIHLLTQKPLVAVITVILFAVHPLRVESVAWIAERKDVLFAFFYLAGLVSYMYYIKTGKILLFVISLLAFPASVLSKFAGISYPLALVAIDFFMNRGINKKTVLEKVPFAFIIFIAGINEFSAGKGTSSVEMFSSDFSIADRIQFTGYSFIFYVYKFFAPLNLSAMYPYPQKTDGAIPGHFIALTIFAAIAFAAVIYFILKSKKYRKELIFGFAFFLINISLVLHIIPFGGNVIVADRYTYLAHIGISFIIGTIISGSLTGEESALSKYRNFLTAILIIFTIAFVTLSWNRVSKFKDTLTLFSDALEKEPTPLIYYYRGIVHISLGDYKSAVSDYEKSLELNPGFYLARNELAKAKRLTGDFTGSVAEYNKIFELKSPTPEMYNDRGYSKMEAGDLSGAIADFTKALEMKPAMLEAFVNRSQANNKYGKFIDAINDCNEAIKISPNNHEFYNYLGNLKVSALDYNGAVTAFSEAVKVKPDYAEAYYGMGLVKSRNLRKLEEAIADYSNAIKYNPKYKEAYNNRAIAKYETQDFAGCIKDLSSVIEMDPSGPMAIMIRGYAKQKSGDMQGACLDWQRAAHLGNAEAAQQLAKFCK